MTMGFRVMTNGNPKKPNVKFKICNKELENGLVVKNIFFTSGGPKL